jgi:signal peptidase I
LRGLDLDAPRKTQLDDLPVPHDLPRRRHGRRLVIGWVIVLTVATAVALIMRATVIEPFSVPSAEMTPTLQVGDRIVVVKSSFLAGPIVRGSIIVFRQPDPYPCAAGVSGAHDLVQRVMALPGQTIWSLGDTLYLDGRPIKDSYWNSSSVGRVRSTTEPIPPITVPAGEYFVMGDNPSQACDSRSFGAIPASSVVGKVVSTFLRAGRPYVHVF